MARNQYLTIFAASVGAVALVLPGTSLAKPESVLGGQSQLAAILAMQGAQPASLQDRPSSFSFARPAASFRTPAVRSSTERSSGRPDVFGTVALKVDRTPLDSKWKGVAQARLSGRAAAFASSLRGSSDESKLEAINRYVNDRVKFADDARRYRRADVWATANDTLNRGRGDCEDYAIAKLQMLRSAGFSDRDLYLVVLRDLVRRSDHAVAVVRSGNQMLVLDNGTNQILESDAVLDYRPILTFAASGGAWTHGYKRRPPSLEMASAAIGSTSAIQPAAN